MTRKTEAPAKAGAHHTSAVLELYLGDGCLPEFTLAQAGAGTAVLFYYHEASAGMTLAQDILCVLLTSRPNRQVHFQLFSLLRCERAAHGVHGLPLLHPIRRMQGADGQLGIFLRDEHADFNF